MRETVLKRIEQLLHLLDCAKEEARLDAILIEAAATNSIHVAYELNLISTDEYSAYVDHIRKFNQEGA